MMGEGVGIYSSLDVWWVLCEGMIVVVDFASV